MRETFSSQVFLSNSSRAAWSEDYIHLDLPWVTAQIRSVLGISGNSQVSQKTSSKKLGKRKTASLEPATLQDRKRVKLDENLESFSPPFWTHSTELRFQKEQPLGGLSQNEAELIAAFRLLSESSQDQVLLGHGYITHLPGDDAGVYLRPSFTKSAKSVRIMSLPVLDDDQGVALGMHYSVYNIIFAVCVLHDNGRLRIGPVEISVRYEENVDPDPTQLPLVLTAKFDISAGLHEIVKPLEEESGAVAEAQRRVIAYLIETPAVDILYPGETNIRYFFSCLSPAKPLPSNISESLLQHKDLLLQLLPFQTRSILFMLEMEGMTMAPDGSVVPRADSSRGHAFWRTVHSPFGNEKRLWYRDLTGDIRLDPPEDDTMSGAMLAETMGLGKTVEIISLVLLHTPIVRNSLPAYYDDQLEVDVKPVKATLIVTPASLIQQWMDEFSSRAPSLKVLLYQGKSNLILPNPNPYSGGRMARRSKTVIPYSELGNKAAEVWHEYAQKWDVVITTYQNLQSDLNVARPPVKRSRRETVDYSTSTYTRSPLVVVEFTRVVMDEVQQVGGGKAAQMVSLTKRLSSVAVSGTPARADVKDLIHVLRFLRVPNLHSTRHWERLITPAFASTFKSLFQNIAVRTSKKIASLEMGLAVQTRYVVPIELGPVEKHNYDERMADSLTQLGLDARGVAMLAGWELDVTILRTAIRKLRQACTHPQVGLNANHKNANSAIRSIDQVLELMVSNNKRSNLDTKRSLIQERFKHALFSQKLQDNSKRYKEAVEELLAIRAEAEANITEIQKAKADYLLSSLAQNKSSGPDSNPLPTNGSSTDEDDSSEDDEVGPSGRLQHNSKTGGYTSRLREARVLLHKAHFLLGDVYHQLGNTTLEDESYATAEELRKQLLKENERRALAAMRALADRARHDVTAKERFQVQLCDSLVLPEKTSNAIAEEITEAYENANDIISLMNNQSELLWKWKVDITALLTQPFVQDGAADGEEYARALDAQGDAESYLIAISALLADRRETMNAERTALASHEHRDTKKRNTQRAIEAAKDGKEQEAVPNNPEQVALHVELTFARKALKDGHITKPLKGVMLDFKRLSRDLKDSETTEALFDEGERIRRVLDKQVTQLDDFETDLAALRKAFNSRVSYFRNLQELSDSVEDVAPEIGSTVQDTVLASAAKIESLQISVRRGLAKQRYLAYLSDHTDDEDDDEDTNCCVLCKCEFTKGFVTECAHVFCQACLTAWMKKRPEGKQCPICRDALDMSSMYRISFSRAKNEPVTVDELLPSLPQNSLQYNVIAPDVLTEITSRESIGQFGSKIQTLVQHLLYLKEREAGSKSIVFSAWSDSLTLVGYALNANNVSFLRVDHTTQKKNPAREFQMNPSYQVLLLHGERDNAGLNVTAARHVFLLEPVVNHSFEVQALARVDRLGGQDTEVYCYYAEDTVEKNILDLAHRRGNSLYSAQPADFDTDVVGERSEDKKNVRAKASKGDFVASTDDMLAIMFPHMYQPIEELDDMVDIEMPEPVAGPSNS